MAKALLLLLLLL